MPAVAGRCQIDLALARPSRARRRRRRRTPRRRPAARPFDFEHLRPAPLSVLPRAGSSARRRPVAGSNKIFAPPECVAGCSRGTLCLLRSLALAPAGRWPRRRHGRNARCRRTSYPLPAYRDALARYARGPTGCTVATPRNGAIAGEASGGRSPFQTRNVTNRNPGALQVGWLRSYSAADAKRHDRSPL